jgi:hypothetical protein
MRHFNITTNNTFTRLLSEEEFVQYVDELIKITTGLSDDNLFINAERYLLISGVAFLRTGVDYSDQTFNVLREFMKDVTTIHEDDAEDFAYYVFKEVDGIWHTDIEPKNKPFHVVMYDRYKVLAMEKARAVAVSCLERLEQISANNHGRKSLYTWYKNTNTDKSTGKTGSDVNNDFDAKIQDFME